MGVHECVSHKLIDPFQVLFDKVANMIKLYSQSTLFDLIWPHFATLP